MSMKGKNLAIVLSVVISFLGVSLLTYAATTISTNIITGGTLEVTGVSTFTDDINADSGTFFVDVSTNRVGVGTTAPAALFSVGGAGGTVTGDAYFTGGLTVGGGATINSIDGSILFASTASDPTGVTQGTLYYNSTNKTLRLYDGVDWFTVGTTTSGLTLSGSKIQLSDLTLQYLTFGTTTAAKHGAYVSVATIAASSTTAVPLTLRAEASQLANLFQIQNIGGTNLVYADSAGALFASSTLQVGGATRLYGALTVDGSVTAGDAVGDSLTVNAGTVAMGNRATTTITNNFLNAWSIATSSTIATPTLTIDTSNGAVGRIGIGTLTPVATLDIVGSLQANGSTTLGSAVTETLTIQSGIIARGTRATTTIPNNLLNVWSIATSTGITPTLSISTASGPVGRIGIGTTSPGALFHVEGDAIFNDNAANYDFRIAGQNEEDLLFIDASGDGVGIASNTPAATFSIDKRNGALPLFIGDDGSSTPYMIIDHTGYVGIGITDPTATLTVDGTVIFNEAGAAANNFRAESDNEANMLMLDATNDAVGIASSSPYATFSVEKRDGVIPFVVGDDGSTTPFLLVNHEGKTVVASSSPISGVRFGSCSVIFNGNVGAGVYSNASTTNCAATNVTGADQIFMTPIGLESFIAYTGASSTANGVIQVGIVNTATTSVAVTAKTWHWMAIR